MIHLILYCLNRYLSGMKQAKFYANEYIVGSYYLVALIAMPVLLAFTYSKENSDIHHIMFSTLVLLHGIIYAEQFFSFKNLKTKNIHTFEFMGLYTYLALSIVAGADILALLAGIYFAGDLLFNAPIQKHFFGRYISKVMATDDSSGKTTNFFLFGKEYKFRNIVVNGYVRLAISIVTIAAYIIYKYYFELPEITLNFIIKHF